MSDESNSPPFVRVAAAAAAPLLLLGIGLLGGWFAASQGRSQEAHDGHEEHEHEAGAALSPRTLGNIGVEIGEAKLSDFVRPREVPAEVELLPSAVRPVHAPVAGMVRSVAVVVGQKVGAGDPIAEIARDPFPRPALALTEAVLQPLDENYHASLTELRSAAQAHAIAVQELERVRALIRAAGEGRQPLPSKAEIDLVYEERRTGDALERARREVERHGLSAEEIDRAQAGEDVLISAECVRRALLRNQLWEQEADAVLAALPPRIGRLRYTVAVLGELAAAGAMREDYLAAIRERPALAAAFLETAGLLQQGASVAWLKGLEASGALAPVVTVRAPDDAPDWDISAVDVKPGAHVDTGSVLATCVDRRTVHLRLAPAGADLPALARALEAGEAVRAEPLVPESGPVLEQLPLVRLSPAEGRASHGAAFASAENAALAERTVGDAVHRTWKLREGLRYLVHVPVERLPGRFVLPASAVVLRGSDMVVLLEDGDSFRAVPVRVEHLDSHVAVVANDGAIFADDRVVLRGAYALSLALQAGSRSAVDPHAGHNHG
ncbi:MAG TPA: biotin/lipoyl-binding protein [Planctomycetota bacterium]|nr:biotin/lipoyl-binding protein [Planctomycetota bacterium]